MLNLKKQVEHCLKNFPETRNSDIALTIKVWMTFYSEFLRSNDYGREYIFLVDLFAIPREDNVKRIRASFNRKMKYLPTDIKIVRARRINEDMWRQSEGYQKIEDTVLPTRDPSYTSRIVDDNLDYDTLRQQELEDEGEL